MKVHISFGEILIVIFILFILTRLYHRRLTKKSETLIKEMRRAKQRLKSEEVNKYYENMADTELLNELEGLLKDPNLETNDFLKYAEEEYRANLIENILISRNVDFKPVSNFDYKI